MATPTPPKPRGFLRRNWRRILLVLLGIIAIVVVIGWRRMESRRAGPPLPVCAAPAPPRKAFGKPLQVTSKKSPGTYNNEPTAALLPSGAVAFAYQAQNGMFGDNGLGVGVIAPDGSVREHPFKTEKKRHFDEWMSADAAGVLHLVWLGHDGGVPDKHSTVGYAESRDGLAWSSPLLVDDVKTDCPNDMPGCLDKPMVVSLKDATLVFYYSEATEGLRAVRVTDQGKTVTPSVAVAEGAYADLHIAPSGVIHVTFVTGDGANVDRFGDRAGHVDFVKSEDGGKTFSKPIRVSAEDEPVPFFFSNPQIAFDEERGYLYVVYPTGLRDGAWDLSLATSRDGGKTWRRTRVNDDPHCANHMTPKAVLDRKTGMLHVVWLENRTGRGAVAYAACSPGGDCAASEAVSDAPFASYTFARHRSDWLGEYGVLLIDETRRVLHAIWSQPVDEGDPTSRIFYARANLAP